VSCVLICKDGADTIGVGGSGLLMSESSVSRAMGSGGGSDAEKLSNETVCGCLCVTSLPCRCFGAGGGCFFPFLPSATSLVFSSSSDSAISYDVRGDSGCISCGGSDIDCRDIDDVSVLLLLSNWGALRGLGTAAIDFGSPDWRGPGLPVMSRVLKLSTSNDALLLPRAGLSAAVRSAALSLSCGSIEASVLANGFAGIPPGDIEDCGAWYLDLKPVDMSVVAVPFPCPALWTFNCPTNKSVLGKLAEVMAGDGFTCSLLFDRWISGGCGESCASLASGCGIKVVFDSMRTCFFVLSGAAMELSSPVTRLLPIHSKNA
jgi:hypothetical protein